MKADDSPFRGLRALAWAWFLLGLFGAAGALAAHEAIEHWSGRGVTLRPWMRDYNSIVLGAEALTLVLFFAGALGLAIPAVDERAQRSRAGALACFGLALAATGLFAGFPTLFGGGPFRPDSAHARLLRALVFSAPLLRAAGWVMLLHPLNAVLPLPGWRRATLLTVATLDLVITAVTWWVTPLAVMARLHVWTEVPWMRAFGFAWLAAGALFLHSLIAATRGRPDSKIREAPDATKATETPKAP